MAMEFWGVEVNAGKPLMVEQVEGFIVHLSQASLGEVKKDKANESIVLSVDVNGNTIVIGTLSPGKCPQISYDLVFDDDFQLSHNWKNGSVYFCGYKAEMDQGSDDIYSGSDSEEEEEEEVALAVPANGKPEPEADKSKVVADKAKAAKPDSSKVKNAKPDDDSEDDDSDEEDDDSEEDGSDDEIMLAGDDSDDAEESSDEEESSDKEESSDEEKSSDEEEEPTPENAKKSKKRPAESPTKAAAPEKKAKLVTPQKSGGDGKKGNAHTATPHPSKGEKTNTKDKLKQSPKSGSQVSCKACSKTFNSDAALQSHTKAKHSDAK